MGLNDLIALPLKYNRALSLFLSDILSLPINSNSSLVFLFCCIFFIFALTPKFKQCLDVPDEYKFKIRNIVLFTAFFIPFLAAGLQISNTIRKLRNNDIIIGKLYTSSLDKECEEFSESLEQAISKNLKPYTSFYFNWMHKKYEDSIPKNFIEPTHKPIVVVGGFCSRTSSHFQVAIEVKVLKITFEPSFPPIIGGMPISYSKDKFESYELHSDAASAISNSVKLISALSIGCEEECYETINNYKDLIRGIEKNRENIKLRKRLFQNLSNIYIKAEKYSDAEHVLMNGVDEFPEDSRLAFNLGIIYLQTSKPDLAETIFLNLSTTPEISAEAKSNLMIAQSMIDGKQFKNKKEYNQDSRGDERIAATAASTEVDSPEEEKQNLKIAQAQQYVNLNKAAITKIKQGKFQESMVDLEIAIMLNPKRADAYTHKAFVLFETERYKEALLTVDKALVIQPKSHQARLLRAVSLSKLNIPKEDVIEPFATAETTNDNDVNVYYQRALFHFDKKNHTLAEQDLKKAISIDPKFPSALLLMTDIYIENKKFLEAKAILSKMQTFEYTEYYKKQIVVMNEKLSTAEMASKDSKKD